MSSRGRRCGSSWTLLLAAAVVLSGCGDGGDGGATEPATSVEASPTTESEPGLSQAQTSEAVLTLAQLGPDWRRDSKIDPGYFDIACGELIESALQGAAATSSASVGYSENSGLPRLVSTVTTYETADGLDAVLDTAASELGACPPMASADHGGYVYNLKFRKIPALRGIDADQEVSYSAIGTVSTPEGEELPVRHHISHVRVGTSIASVQIHSDFVEPAKFHRGAVKVAVERLIAIVDGVAPPKGRVPSPGL